MFPLVGWILLFLAVGAGFILINLLVGKLVRPERPHAEKATIYECGEPTIGSAWVQFDLRFYVVALLFVIFDVEMAFFFPWAVVFGRANILADPNLSPERRAAVYFELSPQLYEYRKNLERDIGRMEADLKGLRNRPDAPRGEVDRLERELAEAKKNLEVGDGRVQKESPGMGRALAWISFLDILIFFGVLLVGFAYLWKRGDLDWVRSTAAQKAAAVPVTEQELAFVEEVH